MNAPISMLISALVMVSLWSNSALTQENALMRLVEDLHAAEQAYANYKGTIDDLSDMLGTYRSELRSGSISGPHSRKHLKGRTSALQNVLASLDGPLKEAADRKTIAKRAYWQARADTIDEYAQRPVDIRAIGAITCRSGETTNICERRARDKALRTLKRKATIVISRMVSGIRALDCPQARLQDILRVVFELEPKIGLSRVARRTLEMSAVGRASARLIPEEREKLEMTGRCGNVIENGPPPTCIYAEYTERDARPASQCSASQTEDLALLKAKRRLAGMLAKSRIRCDAIKDEVGDIIEEVCRTGLVTTLPPLEYRFERVGNCMVRAIVALNRKCLPRVVKQESTH